MTTRFDVIPALGVEILPPRPSIDNSFLYGFINVTDSFPLIHTGTFTLSPLTFSKPSSFIFFNIQFMEFSRFLDPLSLGPKVSQTCAKRL